MPSEQKVVVITGASRGIGAALVKGFRELGYGIVATSRSAGTIDHANDPAIVFVDGDLALSSTGEHVVSKATPRSAPKRRYANRIPFASMNSVGAVECVHHRCHLLHTREASRALLVAVGQ